MKTNTKSKIIFISLFLICFINAIALAQAPLFCTRISGQPQPHQGSGDCDGNLTQSIELRSVGLKVNYSQRWDLESQLGAKNWFLSGTSLILWSATNPNNRAIITDDGFYADLVAGTGALSQYYVVKGRQFPDYFKLVDKDTIQQFRVNTEPVDSLDTFLISTFKRRKAAGYSDDVFYLVNTYNPRTEDKYTINFGPEFKNNENIQLANGKVIQIKREEIKENNFRQKITFGLGEDSAVLYLDSFRNLVRVIDNYLGIKKFHDFKYAANTKNIIEYSNYTEGQKNQVNNQYFYDAYERLTNIITQHPDKSMASRKFRRYMMADGRSVVVKFENGLREEEVFNADGYLIATRKWYAHAPKNIFGRILYFWDYICDNKESPELDYCYRLAAVNENDKNGKRTVYKYDDKYDIQPIGYSIYKTDDKGNFDLNSPITEVIDQRDDFIRKTKYQVKQSGKILSDQTYSWDTNGYLKTVADLITGQKVEYTINPTQFRTTIKQINQHNFTLSEQSFIKDLLDYSKDLLAPAKYQLTQYKYDTEDRVISRTNGGVTEEWAYNSDGLPTFYKDTLGTKINTTYDNKNNVASVITTFTTGIKQEDSYERAYYDGDKLKTIKMTTKLPTGEVLTVARTYAENGDVLEEFVNGVKM